MPEYIQPKYPRVQILPLNGLPPSPHLSRLLQILLLSSGMLSQSGWCACKPLMRSRKQLVSCTTPGRRSLHDAFNLILTLFSLTFNLSSLLTSLSYLVLYLIYSSFISALTAHTCLECLRRRMTVGLYKERKK